MSAKDQETEAARSLARAVEEWNRGDFYESHETLEDVATALEDDDRDYAIALALVKIAASLHKLVNDVGKNAVPGKLAGALAELAGAPNAWRGLDLARLKSELTALAADLDARGVARAFEASSFPRL